MKYEITIALLSLIIWNGQALGYEIETHAELTKRAYSNGDF
jgi:hypothetical protein